MNCYYWVSAQIDTLKTFKKPPQTFLKVILLAPRRIFSEKKICCSSFGFGHMLILWTSPLPVIEDSPQLWTRLQVQGGSFPQDWTCRLNFNVLLHWKRIGEITDVTLWWMVSSLWRISRLPERESVGNVPVFVTWVSVQKATEPNSSSWNSPALLVFHTLKGHFWKEWNELKKYGWFQK